jgi:mannosyl-oligosaccharide alpha-1,2-mannosidase
VKPGAPVLAVGLLLAGCFGGGPAPHAADGAAALHPDLAEEVRAEFLRAYHAYTRLAGGHDELRPLSGTGSDFFAKGHPVRLATIESLDTLYVMGADDELRAGVDFVCRDLSFDIDADFQVFETIIRVEGGLLSGYHATGERCVLDKARDLADRLLPAFQRSPTGMPYRYVNLHTGAVSGTRNVLAEVGTNVVELGDLSLLTGDARYVHAAKAAQKAVFDRRSALDLVGTEIDVETGSWVGTPVASTIDPPVDSFYEYLYEGYLFLGDPDMKAWYDTLTDALVERQGVLVPSVPGGARHRWFYDAEIATGAPVDTAQSELAAFYAGLLAQSGRVEVGRAFHDSWKAALDEGGYRILPEEVSPIQFAALSKGNDLRPEYVDSALLLWLVTDETRYVDRAVEYWESTKATSRVENGYTTLTDVTTRPEKQGDLTPAYWYSENMKYYYLMFGRPARVDYATLYMTTEGNVLRGLVR